jgi:hypothetical protein
VGGGADRQEFGEAFDGSEDEGEQVVVQRASKLFVLRADS